MFEVMIFDDANGVVMKAKMENVPWKKRSELPDPARYEALRAMVASCSRDLHRIASEFAGGALDWDEAKETLDEALGRLDTALGPDGPDEGAQR